ncbi:MAG: alpha-ketoacid dehydrogenase subunit beta [Candidatus Aenigmarchaeota archaeon]|nr:alpha-ketoacid dehydrogenase subunit beta [Candidatus Aenigmarchaeota archaeon]
MKRKTWVVLTAKLTMVEALNIALKQEMAKDSSVIVLGEDVGKDGGVFRVTDGLWEKFGGERVIDTPLAESAIIGASIGLALGGMKPVCEAQFDGFSLPMLDQLISHASRIRWRSRGRFAAHLVLRFPYGGGIRALEHHSDSPEAYYAHTPGLKVVIPSSPYDAKGLLVSAIRDPDPVVFMEPKRVYRAIREDVPETEYTVPIGKANVVQEGSDITLVSWGAMVRECKEALALTPYSVELIDLRTISPMDTKTVIESVKKTGRAVVVQEAPRNCSVSAEVAATIQKEAFLSLKAPVKRVTGFDTVIPFARMEGFYIADEKRIAKEIEKVMKF